MAPIYNVKKLFAKTYFHSFISRFYLLDARSWILGGTEVLLREGGALNLTCQVEGHIRPAEYIHWFRGSDLLNQSPRGGIAINSDKVRSLPQEYIYQPLSLINQI